MKKFIEQINELKEKKYGKAILFFGFYIIFFLLIGVLSRTGSKNYTLSGDYEKGNSVNVSIDALTRNNYKYNYIITLDDVKYEYVGEKYNNLELFEYNNQKYYFDGENYYLYGTDTKVDNPYMLSKFLNYNNIFELLKESYYEAATNYESGKVDYKFLVSSNTINSKFNSIDTDFDEVPNSLLIGTDEAKNVNHIDFILDSYTKVNGISNKSLKIELLYSDFGNIKQIVNSKDES